MPEQKRRILFVINPVAGGKSKGDIETSIHQYFSALEQFETEWYVLSGANDKPSLKYWIDNWQPETVVAIGGDGTLKMVAELLMNTKTRIGLLPAGSANGMAKEFGLPDDLDKCLKIVAEGKTKDIDIISINDDISIHLSDIGLNAQLVKYFEETNQRGKWGYIREVWKVLLNKKELGVQLTVNGKPLFRRAFMVVIANACRYGTGAIINPKGNLSDGLFEIIIIKKISFREFAKMFIGYRGFNKDKTEIFQLSETTISIQGNGSFQIDGEYKGLVHKVNAKVLPKALKVIVP